MITWPKGVAPRLVLSCCQAEPALNSSRAASQPASQPGARLVIIANLVSQPEPRANVLYFRTVTGHGRGGGEVGFVTQNVKLLPEKDNVTRGLLFRCATVASYLAGRYKNAFMLSSVC